MRKFIATAIMVLSLALCFGCAKNSDAPKAELPTPPIRQATELSVTTNTAPSTASAESTPTDNLPVSSRTRLSFCMESVEGILYDVYIVGENEELLGENFQDWCWRHKDDGEIWRGFYYAYLEGPDDEQPIRQEVFLFGEKRYQTERRPWQRVNILHPNRDGLYVVKGENGQPDILVCTIRETGGGSFSVRLFLVKDGALQLVRFMKENGNMIGSHSAGFNFLEYAEDGTLAVPWWTNAKPNAGQYTTFYDLDAGELMLHFSSTIRRNG